jgi:hypothetical protein
VGKDHQVPGADGGFLGGAGQPEFTGQDVVERHSVTRTDADAPWCAEFNARQPAGGDPDMPEHGGEYIGV